jgi:eukaryotic-like serine/threonine-protein kinase
MALSPELQQKMNALLESALKLDPAERRSFLNRACAGNPSLRQEVESRLVAHAKTPASNDVSSARQSKPQPDTGVVVGELVSHYKILSFLGRGGMGEVYLAQDSRLSRKVALKLLPKALSNDEERLRRFEREARSASALSHPNVCVIHEIGETAEGRPYISMEYIDGETLRRRFGHGPLKLREAIDIGQQTASALAAAHEAGVVHRDIKPENIMLRRDGYVKVLDFGLAKLTERYEAGSDSEAPTFHVFSTHSGMLLGTTNYLSPEQARRLDVDERADIWALGVVLYEMVTGRMPFNGETPSHVIVSILETDPEPLTHFLPDMPAELEWIVRKALRKNRDERYQTTKELLSDLTELKRLSESNASREQQLASQVLPTQPIPHSSALESISQTLRRPRLSIASLVVLLLLVGVIGWFIFGRLRNRSPFQLQNLQYIKLTNSGNVTDAAISPDGKYVAYVVDELGKQSLWTRHVPTASNVMIAAPDSVRYQGLTFSKDSNYVYYVRHEKDQIGTLYGVPVLGGVTKRLFGNMSSAVTLAPDGERVAFINENQPPGLMIANIDGSNAQEIPTGENIEGTVSPSWSPDGKLIAFGVGAYTDGYHMTLVAHTVDGGAQKLLTQKRWYSIKRLTWLADNGGLVVDATEQPYGMAQLWRVTYPAGTAERITNDLSDYAGIGLTATADALVTVKSDKSANMWVIPTNDLARGHKLLSEVGTYFGVSWFPDGRVFFSSLTSGNPDIWVINSDGSGLKQLTSNNGGNYHPTVSPDGRYIAFTGYRGGVFNIWRMDADGDNQMKLTKGDSAFNPSWSPDGQWIYYEVLASGNAKIWKVRADGGSPISVTNRHWTRGPVVSPDGQFISCTEWEEQARSNKYAVLPIDGGLPIKLFGNPDSSRLRKTRWSVDGQSIFFVDSRDGNIWSQPISGGAPKQITKYESDEVSAFDLSRDGKQLVVTRGSTVSDVVLIRGLKPSS